MKKSELKEYIRETIIAELTPQDMAANTAAKAAIDDTVKDLTTKVAQTTDAENKKAALASLTAAKTKQAQINKAIQSKQAVPADMLPEGEEDEDTEKEPSKADIKKAEKDLGKSSKHAKKLSAAEEERYDKLKKGITAKVNRLKDMPKAERAKSDDLKALKDIINKQTVKDLFKAKGADLKALISGVIG
jgi:hypothetical protein